nr:MAG TPA: hypothetical protein [Caudoviricetes sp.]
MRVETNHAKNYYHNYHITIYNFSYIQVRGADFSAVEIDILYFCPV